MAESVSLWGCLREINKDRGDQSLWGWFRTSRQSEFIVVVGEDLAALAGLALALFFVALTMLTGNPMWDAVGSIAVGIMLVMVAFLVVVEVKALLVGQSAEPAMLKRIHGYLDQRPEVAQVYSVLTQQMGSEIMPDLHD